MKTFKTLVAIGILALALPASASTITYEYVSDTSVDGPGNDNGGDSTGILTYTLVIDDASGDATFTISGAITSDEIWRAGWFNFKFSEGNTALAISDLDWDETKSGPWSVAQDGVTQVLQGNQYVSITQGGRSAIYVTSLASPAPDDVTQGLCLTDAHCTVDTPTSFTFTVTLPSGWSEDAIEFQAGYYDGANDKGKIITNRLSKELDETVPDGGTTLSLLGGALLGLGLLRRKFNV